MVIFVCLALLWGWKTDDITSVCSPPNIQIWSAVVIAILAKKLLFAGRELVPMISSFVAKRAAVTVDWIDGWGQGESAASASPFYFLEAAPGEWRPYHNHPQKEQACPTELNST